MIGLRLRPHLTAMTVDDPLHDRQPESKPLHTLARGVTDLVVLLEDPLLILRGDAGTVITDGDEDVATPLTTLVSKLGELAASPSPPTHCFSWPASCWRASSLQVTFWLETHDV